MDHYAKGPHQGQLDHAATADHAVIEPGAREARHVLSGAVGAGHDAAAAGGEDADALGGEGQHYGRAEQLLTGGDPMAADEGERTARVVPREGLAQS